MRLEKTLLCSVFLCINICDKQKATVNRTKGGNKMGKNTQISFDTETNENIRERLQLYSQMAKKQAEKKKEEEAYDKRREEA